MNLRLLFRNKLFLLSLVLFIILALVLYFFVFKDSSQQSNGVDIFFGNLSDDVFAPTTLIDSPEEFSWQNSSFSISVFEEDLESGINPRECSFETCSYNASGEEVCSMPIRRFCNNVTEITVGEDQECRYEGRKACQVFVQAVDLAGNVGESNRSFHIDFTPPQVSSVFLTSEESGQTFPIQAKAGEEYQFSVSVQDNMKVGICGLYVDNLYISLMSFSSECGNDCVASVSYQFSEVGPHAVYARCSDQAGNVQDGETRIVAINRTPIIDSCRVTPTQGFKETEFYFSADASDADNDVLTYEWDFGDETMSQGSELTHRYTNPGTYTPKITVQDSSGAKDQCSTAWVVVE